jgi:uncharacterized membrane protein
MTLVDLLRTIAQAIATLVEAVGIAIVAVAVLVAAARYVAGLLARVRPFPPEGLRLGLGRSLALSLEFLLGADILRTAVEPSWDEIARLAAIAAIRTALNFFLQREIAQDARLAVGADRESMRDLLAPAQTPAAQPGVPTAGGNRSHGHGLPV